MGGGSVVGACVVRVVVRLGLSGCGCGWASG